MENQFFEILKTLLEGVGENCCSLKSYGDCPCKAKMREILTRATASDVGVDANFVLNTLQEVSNQVKEKPCGDSYICGCEKTYEMIRMSERLINEIENREMPTLKIEVGGKLPESCRVCKFGRVNWPQHCVLDGQYQNEYESCGRPSHCPLVLVK